MKLSPIISGVIVLRLDVFTTHTTFGVWLKISPIHVFLFNGLSLATGLVWLNFHHIKTKFSGNIKNLLTHYTL